MKAITLYIGLDVHKDSITLAIAEAGHQGEALYWNGKPASAPDGWRVARAVSHRGR